MPSNKELTDKALDLAKKLGVEVKTGGNNADLTKLVEDLTAQLAAKETPPPPSPTDDPESEAKAKAEAEREAAEAKALADAEAAAAAAAQAEAEAKAAQARADEAKKAAEAAEARVATYTVVAGRGITSKRGIIGGGDRVFARDFEGGQAILDDFVERGLIVKS